MVFNGNPSAWYCDIMGEELGGQTEENEGSGAGGEREILGDGFPSRFKWARRFDPRTETAFRNSSIASWMRPSEKHWVPVSLQRNAAELGVTMATSAVEPSSAEWVVILLLVAIVQNGKPEEEEIVYMETSQHVQRNYIM
mmetsp:Transcript_29535/g.55365  ORF Transcript_29535/g.55365 Transcript_29535/m.55365 type:complete len:140 (+) Transcript_29535:85-504(+)